MLSLQILLKLVRFLSRRLYERSDLPGHYGVCPVVCLSVSHRGTPPSGNYWISKIPKPKFVSAHSEQLFRGGGELPVKGKIFDTRFGLIHVETGKKKISRKKFLKKIFFYAHFIELAELSVSQFSS